MKSLRITRWIVQIAAGLATAALGELNVLCTTFPLYQITRNVAHGRDGVKVELMLPASLGCPHHYSLTPQNLQKLARAQVLVVNGLGMEEFLGAPVAKANTRLRIVDSSAGIEGLLPYADEHTHGHEQGEEPFEWVGIFDLAPGTYRWTFAKKGGQYAEPTLKMVILRVPGKDATAIERVKPTAAKAFEADAAPRKPGAELTPDESAHWLEFDDGKDATTFTVRIRKAGTYAFFTEHRPTEFEAGEHFFKNDQGRDVEPVAQFPDSAQDHGHAHGHADPAKPHDHHPDHDPAEHEHRGFNPHLFASPRQAALLAENIAAGLSKADPEGAGVYFKNAKAYAQRMNALADEMAALVQTLKNNRIVQPHGVFDYLARDIGLEIVAVTQPHGQEPSAAEMLELVQTVREKKAGAIFTEPQYSPKVGQTIARETGVPAAVLDPAASGPDNAPLDYYEKVMRKNMETLRTVLGVRK